MSMLRIAVSSFAFLLLCSQSQVLATPISGRVDLGNELDEFFEGLPSGVDTYTNTVTFEEDSIVVSLTITAEGFDAAGSPAPLNASPVSSGVGVGSDNDLNTGESIRFTYDSISATTLSGAPPIDPSTIMLTLSTVAFAGNFTAADSFSYSGIGVGTETLNGRFLEFDPSATVNEGDSFTVTAVSTDSNGFSLLFISQGADFQLQQLEIPEPASLGLMMIGVAASTIRRRV